MTGFFSKITDMKKERIKELTKEGLSTYIISERLGMSKEQIYYYQVKLGLRVNKKNEKND